MTIDRVELRPNAVDPSSARATTTSTTRATPAVIPLGPSAPARPGIGTRLSDAFGDLQRWGGRWERRQFGNSGVALYRMLISQRVMNTYGANGSYGLGERLRVVNSIAGALDNSGVAVFVGELNALLADRRALAFLDDLEGQLARGTRTEPTRLWDLALHHAGSRDEAIRWLAVLLQDYSPFALQGRGVVEAIRDPGAASRLRRVLQAVARAEQSGSLAAYPPGEDMSQARFYHYYVPALFARRLVERGVAPELAFLTGATFNLEYELAKPSVLAARQVQIADCLKALLQRHAGVSPAALDALVASLRGQHRVDATFEVGDLSFITDLRLSPETVRAVCSAIATEYTLPDVTRQTLLEAAGSPELSINLIAETVNAAYTRTVANHAADLSLPGLLGDAGDAAGPGLAFANAGRHAALPMSEASAQSAYAGFSGAANVLPGSSFAMSREQLVTRLAANPVEAMQALFAAPRASLASTAGVRSSDPPPVVDTLHERLRDYTGSRGARATVAIIDDEFNGGVPAGGRDFIDRDDDPTTRAMLTLHGTPVVDLATRGTPGVTALPLRADFATTPDAIQHAADQGATCVVISQQMTAADPESLELFRAVLRRNPNLLVVVASGNHGATIDGHAVASLDEPNLVVVAAADANGMVSPRSNHHPRFVRFAVRGGSRDDRLWQDPANRFSNWVLRQTRPNVEHTSQAAPAFANLYAKVRLLAPSMGPSVALRVISLTSDTDPVTATRVRDGVPSAERAQQLAALYELTRQGRPYAQAAQLLGLRPEAAARAERDLQALRRAPAAN